MWKAVYTRVVGHTPLSKEVDDFMRKSWEGKAIDETAMREVFQLKQAAEPVAGGTPVATPVAPVEKVTAKIDGSQLQALRSRLSGISAQGGLEGNRAAGLLKQIDSAIARNNTKLAERLAIANRQYTATKTLENLIQSKSPGIFQGNVDLEQLGKELASRGAGPKHPLHELGQIGEQLQIRGRFDPRPQQDRLDVLNALLGKAGRAIGTVTGGRSAAARAIQRRMKPRLEERPRLTPERAAATVATETGKTVEGDE
jgi:hypothetical protein